VSSVNYNIGQTTRSLDEGVKEHIGYIRNLHRNQPTGEHFNHSWRTREGLGPWDKFN